MRLDLARSLPFTLWVLVCSSGLGGCFPSVERQYFASTAAAQSFGISAGCSVDGDAHVKLPAGVRMAIRLTELTDKPASVGVSVSLPAGLTAHFAGDAGVFRLPDSTEEWGGSLIGSGKAIYDPATKHIDYAHDSFAPQTDVHGGARRSAGIHETPDDVFYYVIKSDRVFPKEFSARLPDFVIDGNAATIPVVHFRYGRGLALCGCCGT